MEHTLKNVNQSFKERHDQFRAIKMDDEEACIRSQSIMAKLQTNITIFGIIEINPAGICFMIFLTMIIVLMLIFF
ncbi:unnamed protein product [Caenorhabditis bovis]|uniref:Uncharacterized protein n=1 Tax=Caenorhabditis bovis TaxID=2654633 RepID=A0A8S1F8H3_9PELO|nr:unnamed protein product [Caenorhabditis bovis]